MATTKPKQTRKRSDLSLMKSVLWGRIKLFHAMEGNAKTGELIDELTNVVNAKIKSNLEF